MRESWTIVPNTSDVAIRSNHASFGQNPNFSAHFGILEVLEKHRFHTFESMKLSEAAKLPLFF